MREMSEVKSAGITELQAAISRGEQVIDVRELHEFDSGHVPGAVHIPMSVIPVRMNEIKKDEEIDQKVIDAVLVDFINFIGFKHGIDYALYTSDLRKS